MEQEKSCGAILFRQNKDKWQTLLLKHRKGHWAFAKGHVEQDETEGQTALREILEETGIVPQLDTRFRITTEYVPFPGTMKEVVYFIGYVNTGQATPQLEEISELHWVSCEDAMNEITFETDKRLFLKAWVYVQEQRRDSINFLT